MKHQKKKILSFVFIFVLLLIAGIKLYFFTPKHNPYPLEARNKDMDFVVINTTGEIIKLTNIKVIEPTIWKGSYDGELYYKDGSSIEVEVSSYGNFFGIKGETPSLFSNGKLYQYNY